MTKTPTTDLLSVARAMRDYIDALPSDVVASLPTMPGFDRDWADEVIEGANREAQPVQAPFMYAICNPDGSAWLDENCVAGTAEELKPVLSDLRRDTGDGFCIVPLYTAPPSPVVNPEFTGATAVPETVHSSVIAEQLAHVLSVMEVTDHQRAVIGCAVDRLNKTAEILQEKPAVPDISALTELIVDRLIDCSAADDDSIADAETFVYNACRAAMLAQPVGQGCNWIACGEQLPAVGETVLVSSYGYVSVGESVRSWGGYRYFTSVETGRELTATHWMPLPAAPGDH